MPDSLRGFYLRPVVSLWAALALAICSTDVAAQEYIAVQNPEDIIAVPGSHFAIVSSMPDKKKKNGAIIAVDTRTRKPVRLFPKTDLELAVPEGSSCPGVPVAAVFAPHGITLVDEGAAKHLYVINHDERNAIDIFSLNTDDDSVRLSWIDCLPVADGALLNSVAVIDDTVFATNNAQPLNGDAVDPFTSDVLMWRADTGWKKAIAKNFALPNGLVAAPDGKRLYFAASVGRELIEIQPGTDEPVRRVSLNFMPDNLRWDTDGMLLAAGLAGEFEAIFACFGTHPGADRPCRFPTAVARINPTTMDVVCSRVIPQNEHLGTATVAAPVGGALWVGQFDGGDVMVSARLSEPSGDGGC